MRFIILGAGAIGCAVGGNLARVGKDVILIGRPGHVNAINAQGLRFVTPVKTYILKIPAVTSPKQIDFSPDDVVIVTVKSQDTPEALRELHAVVEDVPVFCYQNGVRNEEVATRYFTKVYGVNAGTGGIFLTDGEASGNEAPAGSPKMGCYPTGKDDLVEAVAANLRTAGFEVLVTRDIVAWKWASIPNNLTNAVNAITNINAPHIQKAAEVEGTEIIAQAGIRGIPKDEMPPPPPQGVHREHRVQNSTWQSLARQRPTIEVDFFQGEMVRLAEQLGRRAPVNETLLRITKEMVANHEKPGKYTPSELSRLCGL